MRANDLTGNRYGRLVVLERDFSPTTAKRKKIRWKCQCDCGNIITVDGDNLRSGHTTSCGCASKEAQLVNCYKHGGCIVNKRLYKIYQGIKTRCYNKNNPNYIRYGARGITMCDEWYNSFESFRDWALSNGYEDSLSIERIDVDGIYEPSNCTWIAPEEQCKNKRSSIKITLGSETHIINDWAKILGVQRQTLTYHVKKYGNLDRFVNEVMTKRKVAYK